MKHKHSHCACEEDRSDFRRGRYEAGEAPEADRVIARVRRLGPRALRPAQRTSQTPRHN